MGFSQADTVHFSRRSVVKGLSIFALDVAALLVSAYGALTISNPVLQLGAAFCLGIVVGVLFVVGHDAAHQSLTPYRKLNGLVGRLAMLPSCHAFSLWELVHNQTHHRWTNLSPSDYVWLPLSPAEFKALPRHKQAVYRFYRGLAGPLAYYVFEFWIKRIVLPSRREVRGTYKTVYLVDIFIVFAFMLAYWAFLIIGGANHWFQPDQGVFHALVFGFVIPFAVWNVLMGFVIYLHHTHPGIRWYNDKAQWRSEAKQCQSTVHVVFPGPINFVFHRIMEHNAHHVRPSIPMYNLHAAQKELVETENVIELKWTPRSHLDVVRRCKLFDFEARRWTDFAGNFTSPVLGASTTVPSPHFSSSKTSSLTDSSPSDSRTIDTHRE